MKGLVTPIVICGLTAAPLLFAVFRAPGKLFVGVTAVVGATALAGYVAYAGYGYRFVENLTGSLDGHIYVYKQGVPFKKGDIVAYRWRGGFNYAPGSIFIKRVAGEPGEEVRRDGRAFYVGSHYIGLAKTNTRAGEPLEAAAGGPIPEGEFFLATPSPHSLDSRYAATGNVKAREIIGKAYEIF